MFCWLASCRVCQGHVSLPSSRRWGKSGEGTARRAETRSCGPGVGERACGCSWPHGGLGRVVLARAATEGLLLVEEGAPGGWHVTRSLAWVSATSGRDSRSERQPVTRVRPTGLKSFVSRGEKTPQGRVARGPDGKL